MYESLSLGKFPFSHPAQKYDRIACVIHIYYRHMATESLQQSQTLSLRISEALRKRLEDIRKLTALRKGESVSTSGTAKNGWLAEDRFEVVELLAKPAEALPRSAQGGWGELSRAQGDWWCYRAQGSKLFSGRELGTDGT